METKLKKYFPMIREREEILAKIAESEVLQAKFAGWKPEQQEEFLDICFRDSGVPAIRRICCFASIRGCGAKQEKNSVTGTSRMYI